MKDEAKIFAEYLKILYENKISIIFRQFKKIPQKVSLNQI